MDAIQSAMAVLRERPKPRTVFATSMKSTRSLPVRMTFLKVFWKRCAFFLER